MVNTTIFSIFFGNYPYSDFFCSAFFGLATVLVIFLLVRDLLNTNYALATAFFLAISPFHIYYSRLGMAETDASFFLAFSLLLFSKFIFKNNKSNLYITLSGLSLGWFFICNYRWIYLIPFFVMVVFYASIKEKKRIKYLILFIISFLLIPIITHIMYIIGEKVFNVGHHGGYFGMMLDWYQHQIGKSKGLFPHMLYLNILSFLNSYFFMILALGGLAIILKSIKNDFNKKYIYILLFCIVMLPLVIFSLKTRGDKLVALSVVAPFSIIYFILGLKYLFETFRIKPTLYNRIASVLLILMVGYTTLYQLRISKDIISLKSGYAEANEWLNEQKIQKYFATEYAVYNYYTGRKGEVLELTEDKEKTENLVKSGFHFLVMDIHKWYHGPGTPFQFYKEIENELEPIVIFENNAFNFHPYIIDDFHFRHNDEKFMNDILSDPEKNKIKIYDLRKFYN